MIEQILSFVVPLLYLMGATASLVFLTKRSFGKCLPIAMMLSAFLLFFSQIIFGSFMPGFIVGIICAISSVGLGIWRRKQWMDYKKLLFTSGFVVFVVIYVMVFMYDFARGFSAWDEFSHWGMMVKEMVRLDKFYSVEASNLLVHQDYPPIMQLFELFWAKLCGGYNEIWLERALHTFELSLFVPFLAEKVAEKKSVWKSVVVGVAMVFAIMLMMLLFDQHGVLATIYTDYVMAMVVVFLLMTVIVNREITWFEVINLMIGGAFLLLLKQMGLPLYLMVIGLFVGMVWLRKKEKWTQYLKMVGWKKILLVAAALFLPLLIWMVWGRIAAGTVKQFDLSSMSIMDFIKVLMGQGEEWQRLTTKNYLMALGQENISTSYIEISYLQAIIMFIVSLWFLGWKYRKELIKKEVIFIGAVVILGAFLYAAAMMVLYVIAFDSYEGVTLASFNRYMGTYAMIMMLLVIMIMAWQATEMGKRNIIYATTLGLALINAPVAYGRIYPYVGGTGAGQEYKLLADKIIEVVPEGKKVFLVTQDSSLKSGFYLQYYLTPIRMSYGLHTWPVEGTVDGQLYYDENVAPVMSQYDYLLLLNKDEAFDKLYCSSLGNCNTLKKGIYEIEKDSFGDILGYRFLTELQ